MAREKRNKTAPRDGFAHLVSVLICTGILFLFVALTYSQINLPRYTTKKSEKDVQQVINLMVTVVATVIGILFSHCRRLTNEAETRAELRDDQLTIPRLHVHYEAAGGSKAAMGLPVIHNKQVWPLVAFYFLAMIIFAFIHSVLSVIFVIDAVLSDKGEQVPVSIPLSIDIPEYFNGTLVDTCAANINSPACTYDLALHALTSQLVTYQPYVIAGVTFEPPNGTMGLPYHAMKHFQNEVASTPFDDARRRYCLPVMDPHTIKCTEVPINHTTCESADHFVKFKSLNVTEYFKDTNTTEYVPTGLYKIASPFPNSLKNFGSTKLRIDTQGRGVMIVQKYSEDDYTTLIGGADAYGEFGYATMLHRLMYNGANPNTSTVPPGATYDFAARCEMTPIQYQDNLGSSWRQVDFTLRSGVLRANITEEQCPNARAASGKGWSGFLDLTYALEGACDVIGSTDGYSKFFNEHPRIGQGTNIFANMSHLDIIVNQIYHIVQTAWTESSYEYAMQIPRVTEEPIMMTSYPHLFVIRISWTPTTYIGLVFSLLIAINAWVLAVRWFRAIYKFGLDAERTWNLLRPVDLMAYTLSASQDLIYSLNTAEHRKAEMRGTHTTVLHERPIMDLISFMPGGLVQRVGSESSAGDPMHEHEAKAGDEVGPGVSVRERQADPERGA